MCARIGVPTDPRSGGAFVASDALPASRISLANDLTYSGLIEALVAVISPQNFQMGTARTRFTELLALGCADRAVGDCQIDSPIRNLAYLDLGKPLFQVSKRSARRYRPGSKRFIDWRLPDLQRRSIVNVFDRLCDFDPH